MGFRSRFMMHHYMLQRRSMVHYHMLRSRFTMHYDRPGGRYNYRLAAHTAAVMAKTQGQVITAAESHYYHTGHQEHFKHILFHLSMNRGLCLYMNEAHQHIIYI